MSGGHWKEVYLAACEGDLDLVDFHVKTGVDANYAYPEFLSTPLVASLLAGQEEVARTCWATAPTRCCTLSLTASRPRRRHSARAWRGLRPGWPRWAR